MQDKLAKRIFISGFMGAGKSTIGQALGLELKYPFFDLDKMIESQAGQSIPQIFETKGERVFRKLEQEALMNVTALNKGVIALGGGTLQNQSIVDELKTSGLLIFIEVSMEVILQRVLKNEYRPMLWADNGKMKPKKRLIMDMEKLYEQRLPFYRQADIIIKNSGSLNIDAIIRQIQKEATNDAK